MGNRKVALVTGGSSGIGMGIALELAVTEMFFGSKEDMDSVIINETVELVKKFGGEEDYQFVNGVLGTLSRSRTPEQEQNPEAES